jgi:hypothetical protein
VLAVVGSGRYYWGMNTTKKRIVLAITLLLVVPALVSAQSDGMAAWVERTGAHRIVGYTTLGVATTTAALGLFGVTAVHPYAGGLTAGLSVANVTLGLIAYRDRLSYFWPHAVLNTIATTGFLVNTFFLEGGSPAHIGTGIGSLALMYGAYGIILWLTG